MKDAYSFHSDEQSLDETYKIMYETYKKIFSRCGLKYVIVEAESGEMGGSGSHQFTVPCDNGEDVIVQTEDGSYAANIEKAPVDAMAAITGNKDYKPVEEIHTPGKKTIEEICTFLTAGAKELIKTLVYKSGNELILVLVRGDFEINPEKLRCTVGKSIELADEATIKNLTGAEVGFAGPVGLTPKINKLIIDHSVLTIEAGITGANKTDYHIKNVVPGRDFPIEGKDVIIADVRNAVEGDTYKGQKLLFKRGIEVGQVFKLGTKYSAKLGAKFLDKDSTEKPCIMGCYGIGINRIAASAIEIFHDNDGIIWPISIAPFEVIVTPAGNGEEIAAAAEKLYNELMAAGVEVLLDDRDARGGVKFKDADLIGIPIRITIGAKSLAENNAEIKLRREKEIAKVPLGQVKEKILQLIEKLKAE
jgi:prolyl-tRNA synthetase